MAPNRMAKAEAIQIVVVSLVLMTAVLGGVYVLSTVRSDDPIQDRKIIDRGQELPVLWIFLNDSGPVLQLSSVL